MWSEFIWPRFEFTESCCDHVNESAFIKGGKLLERLSASQGLCSMESVYNELRGTVLLEQPIVAQLVKKFHVHKSSPSLWGDSSQQSRLYLRTGTESSLRNVVFYLLRTANNVQEFLYFVTFSFVPFGIASLLPSPQAGELPLVGCPPPTSPPFSTCGCTYRGDRGPAVLGSDGSYLSAFKYVCWEEFIGVWI
jgi:hypothetical protein